MKPILFFLVAVPLLLFSCKTKKKALTGEEPVTVEDFVDYFDEIKLPVNLGDTSLAKKTNDSLLIAYNVFTQFVPDSLLTPYFGKASKLKIYPIGKVTVKKAETYLFMKAYTAAKQTAFVLAFNKDNQYAAGLPLIVADKDIVTTQLASMDNKYTISTSLQKKAADGQLLYRKNAYVFNSEGVFTLILTESNDMAAVKEILVNPIDTFASKNKLSGDYIQNKNNLVSVRDGKNSSELLVFVHFEKDNGTCKGELKGRAKIVNENKAIFQEQGDPCHLEFNFKSGAVSLKEEGACGSYRDIRCFFEGNFIKKKEPKPAKPVKKK